MSPAVALVRSAGALAIVAAIIATYLGSAAEGPVNPFNFFGYFTIQSNAFAAIVLAIAAITSFSGGNRSHSFAVLRGCATAYMVIVGIVYNTLLTGLAGGVTVPWANTVMHLVMPIYLMLDWVLFADRPPLRWRALWVVAIYPLLWLSVILIRGATDGWVPYPFLDPAQGYGTVALYAGGIAVAIVGGGAIIWKISHWRNNSRERFRALR